MDSSKQDIIGMVATEVEEKIKFQSSAESWLHTERVWHIAKQIGEVANADLFIIELAALLHDIAAWNFHDGSVVMGHIIARRIMDQFDISKADVAKVCYIIENLPSRIGCWPASTKDPVMLEEKIVRDADEIDKLNIRRGSMA